MKKIFMISVQKEFSAAHRLMDYKGKCENFHGHNWTVEVTIASETLNNLGMVMDFHDVKEILDVAIARFDHSCLNDLDEFKKLNPTSEHIAMLVFDRMSEKLKDSPVLMHEVSVWETATNKATVREQN